MWFPRSTGTAVGWGAYGEGAVYAWDTVNPYVVEGEVTEVALNLTEWIVPRVTDAGVAGLTRSVSDTVRGRVTDGVGNLEKAGNFNVPASDTITPVVTEDAGYDASLSVADTVTPVVTDITTFFDGTKDASDTVLVVLNETATVNSMPGTLAKIVSDTITVMLADSAANSGGGDVDRIRIVERRTGRIRINAA
jgi:hypothetical protein